MIKAESAASAALDGRGHPLPTGTLTFCFTDIEGSTVRWEHHPQAMRTALARHDAVLYAGITDHGGVVVTERGEGDSFFALFARPSDAVAAACALQRTVAVEPWPAEITPIRVRIAIHTGEAGLWDGRDYRGAAVNRCARLRSIAHGGQVLLSRASYELVREALPAAITLRDLGEHRLKDLTFPEHIYQIVDPTLGSDFPPLHTSSQARHALPVRLTPFVGRDEEVTTAVRLLCQDGARLLTLTGPGGVGKTRLALEVATMADHHFVAGVVFVPLAALTDPTPLVATLAQALQLLDLPGQSLLDGVRAYLHEKRLLLLLDNCEQVAAGVGLLVADLLATCPGLTVLATSRVPLHIQGEHLTTVAPLTLPDLTHLPPPDVLAQNPAVALFLQRARALKPSLTWTEATATAIAAICVRLDGLPLALELAATRITILPPQTLLARLEQRLTVLTSGPHDLPPRQRTLRNTLAWSYDLLSSAEQAVFRGLGVFVGGCTLEAIEALGVAPDRGESAVLDSVASLTEKGLLQQDEQADGEPRFTMLETIREYAREQLAWTGDEVALRERHADYFQTFAAEVERGAKGSEQRTWYARAEVEYENLRAAAYWLTAHGQAEQALSLVSSIGLFWIPVGRWKRGRGLLADLLAIDGTAPTVGRAKALGVAGFLAVVDDDSVTAQRQFEESLAIGDEVGDQRSMAYALAGLGWAGHADLTRAQAVLERSAELFRAVDDRYGLGWALGWLGEVHLEQGETAAARLRLEEALTIQRESSDQQGVASTLASLAAVPRLHGDLDRARHLLDESAALQRALGDRNNLIFTLDSLGAVALDQGEVRAAGAYYAEALRLAEDLGGAISPVLLLYGCARTALATGQAGRALRLAGAAEALRETVTFTFSTHEQAIWDRCMAQAREALDEEAVATAWAEGRALTRDQAIAIALED